MVEVTVASGLISVVTGGGNMSIPADAIVSIRVHNKPVRIARAYMPTGDGMGVFVEGAGDSAANGLYALIGTENGLPLYELPNGYHLHSVNLAPDYSWLIETPSDGSVYKGVSFVQFPWNEEWEASEVEFEPAPVVRQATVNNTGYINSDQWFIRIRLKDNTFEDFIMGEVSNQPTWVNTQAGANIAESDLDAIFA